MQIITLLNQCYGFPGLVYHQARLNEDRKRLEIRVRPRVGSKAICSGCRLPEAGYDQLAERPFEFIPVWGFLVFLLYRMRRVHCKTCGVVVEEVPWADGKHSLTKAYMLFLAHLARKLSWKETAASFHTTWDKVGDAVQYVVDWGLAHRSMGPISAIGVDEIQYAKGHKYLTLVYPIDSASTRWLWIGQERTVEAFQGFFAMLGTELSSHIQFVCSDMWKPYLRVVRDKCSQALHILDRFHIVPKMNEALDDVRAAESRKMAQDGYEALLHKSRWCILKRKANLTSQQKFRLRDLLRYNLQTVRAYLLKEDFQRFKLPDDFVLYCLRHTMLTRLGESGADAFTIMRVAGHSSITTSQRYVHPSSEALSAAIARLDSANQAAWARKRTDTTSDTSNSVSSVSH